MDSQYVLAQGQLWAVTSVPLFDWWL